MNPGIRDTATRFAQLPRPAVGGNAPMPSIQPRRGWSPHLVPGLRLWLDASRPETLFDSLVGGGIPRSGGAVARWEDLSGNGFHASQGTANNRPTRSVRALNGLDGIAFNGTNNGLFGTLTPLLGYSLTMFVVARTNNATTRQGYIDLGNYTTTTGQGSLTFEQNSNATAGQRFCLYHSTGTSGSNWDTTLATSTSPFILSASAKTLSTERPDAMIYRVNGVTSGAWVLRGSGPNNTAYSANISGFLGYGVGTFNANGSTTLPLNGVVYEVIVFRNTLTVPEMQAAEAHLADKWGLSL